MSICSGQAAEGGTQGKAMPRRKPRLHDYLSIDIEGSPDVATSDEENASLLAGIGSGTGILEFSPERAGLDVTPADLDFADESTRKSSPPLVLSALAGQTVHCIVIIVIIIIVIVISIRIIIAEYVGAAIRR